MCVTPGAQTDYFSGEFRDSVSICCSVVLRDLFRSMFTPTSVTTCYQLLVRIGGIRKRERDMFPRTPTTATTTSTNTRQRHSERRCGPGVRATVGLSREGHEVFHLIRHSRHGRKISFSLDGATCFQKVPAAGARVKVSRRA